MGVESGESEVSMQEQQENMGVESGNSKSYNEENYITLTSLSENNQSQNNPRKRYKKRHYNPNIENILESEKLKMKFPKTRKINRSLKTRRNELRPKRHLNRLKPGQKQVRYRDPIYSVLLMDKCVKRMYLTPVWKKTFGTLARYISFKTNIVCNDNLILHILGDYDERFKNINTVQLKKILIKGYEKYMVDYKKMILNAWNKQNKGLFTQLYKTNSNTLDEIINKESYIITPIDIMIISMFVKIGIVMFFPSRENYNLKIGYYDEDRSYYIKVTNKHTYYLVSDDRKYYFKKSELNPVFNNRILEEYNRSTKERLLF